MDFPITIAPLRGYNHTALQCSCPVDHRKRNYTPYNLADDNLDPVSALLKAGEIINRHSKGRPGS
jgi:hypothetical protein